MNGNIFVVIDRYGVKHVAPYSLTRGKGSAKGKRMKRNNVSGSFDKMLLDGRAVVELQYQGTEYLENVNRELAKTPSTERKGVY